MRAVLLAGLLFGLGLAHAQPRPLVMAIDSATEMPMALVQDNQVVGGMNHALGRVLAQRMGHELRYIAVPRKRVLEALERGDADFVCTYLPAWLPGPLQWSQAFFRQQDVLVTRAEVPAPRRLQDLRGQRIGTVLGFVYVELERALEAEFLRDDAPNALANLRKLAAGRLDHAVVEGRLLSHVLAQTQPALKLHPRLPVSSLLTQCALGPKAAVSLAELNQAIDVARRDGSLQALYARYD
ncbi:ABC-type amino acid transport substrate-binding protein [Inhella inkyongensis]|uniref:ABC-type amino acid transport substrate-binding protein n=1 Tax=Inhella inkyongensis TaxID=392593 RepID=A0A840S0A0_9BURK|nr:transporter substrate-binding domain-containing protein [Inhella inkyongensis]MBB5202798.1 ABC-type amino acid transport substrate-binding protein [Inhella inkyongensis]